MHVKTLNIWTDKWKKCIFYFSIFWEKMFQCVPWLWQRFSMFPEFSKDHLVNYVLTSTKIKKGSDPQRIQRKRSLHAAMCDREEKEKGKASSLVAESLKRLADEEFRTDGHFILELLVKPSEVGFSPGACSVIFEADQDSVRKILDLGLAGGICLRLAVKFALRFCFAAAPVCLQHLPPLIDDHVTDRARLAGLVEYLALCNSLHLLLVSNTVTMADAKCAQIDLNMILEKLTFPPADAAVLELLCQHCSELCEQIASMLLSMFHIQKGILPTLSLIFVCTVLNVFNFNVCPRVLEHGWPRHASLPGVVQLKSCFVQDCPYFLHLQTPYIHFLSHSWLSLFALRLLSTGQLKLARKIERLKHPRAHHDLPAPSPVDHSPAGIASRSPLTLHCKVILVSDVCSLEAACQRARQGGVIGSLEFAKIRVHFGPLSMCFSW